MSDPPRLDELLRQARKLEPPPEDLRSVREALGARVDAPVSPPGLRLIAKGGLGVVGLVAVVSVGLWLDRVPRKVPPSEAARVVKPAAAPMPSPEVSEASEETPGSVGSGGEPPRQTAPASPSVAPASRPGRAPRLPESELLDRAQAALAARPERALMWTRLHRRDYPDGLLSQEREAIVIRALSRLGRHARARRRLRSFERRWPHSAHIPALRELLEDAAPDP